MAGLRKIMEKWSQPRRIENAVDTSSSVEIPPTVIIPLKDQLFKTFGKNSQESPQNRQQAMVDAIRDVLIDEDFVSQHQHFDNDSWWTGIENAVLLIGKDEAFKDSLPASFAKAKKALYLEHTIAASIIDRNIDLTPAQFATQHQQLLLKKLELF